MNETISELQNTWSRIQTEISKNIEDRHFFDVYLNESYIHSIDNGIMMVVVGSNLAVTILSQKYTTLIQDAAKVVLGTPVKVKFNIKENIKTVSDLSENKQSFFKSQVINPSFTFDSFISGPSNLEAKQAALYVAQNPGKAFNPLFIYSNSGLGKTHLLHAIVNYVHENMPGKKTLYCDSIDFFNEYVKFLAGQTKGTAFKDYCTSCDIFLIDDIQNIASKEQTLITFFEIFNSLHAHGKQIIITSDKHPSELKSFDERLKSRFAAGLTISINQPDVQTCVSILKNKIENSPLDINSFDPRVLELIAQNFSKNIRDIDQAFNRLLWYVTSFRPSKFISLDISYEALQQLLDVKQSKQKLNEQRIISAVADYYNKTPSQLTGTSRQGDIVFARHIAMYMIRKMLDTPYTKIGMIFGGKDHSTVMNGVEKVEKELKTNPNIETVINEVKSLLKA
jgi:chromosomal replication initiator protein